jgi:hypothetical protein
VKTDLLRKHSTLLHLLFVAFFVFIWSTSTANSCTSASSGNWIHATTWSCTGMPASIGCGKTITILAEHTVTVDNQINYMGCPDPIHIIVYGTFQFTNGNKLDLPCGSIVEIMPGGVVKKATPGGGNSTLVGICNTDWWIAGDGPQSGYQLWGNVNPLPVELTDFTIQPKESNALINWSTATETNNDYFKLERSLDYENWSLVATFPGKGNSSTLSSYQYLDKNPGSGTIYYKLTQHDFNGNSEQIAQGAIQLNSEIWNVYPNPGNGFWAVESNFNSEPFSVILTDALGKPVPFTQQLSGNRLLLTLENNRIGHYLLVITSENKNKVFHTTLISY